MITKEQKQEIVAKYGKDANDTGSAEVQIALLTARINDLLASVKSLSNARWLVREEICLLI